MKKLTIKTLFTLTLVLTLSMAVLAQSSATMVNSASYTPSNTVAANSIASVFGTNLSVNTVSDNTLPYGTSLDGVEVTVGGTLSLLSFVSPSQINLIVPSASLGTKALVVKRNGVTTHTGTINIQRIVAGFFNYGVVTPATQVNVGYVERYGGFTLENQRNFYLVSNGNLVAQALENYVSGKTYIAVLFLTGASNSNTNTKVFKMRNTSTNTVYFNNLSYSGSCFCSPGLDQVNVSLSNNTNTAYIAPSGTYECWVEWDDGSGGVITSTNTFTIIVP